jgi:DNA-binding protein H-NS
MLKEIHKAKVDEKHPLHFKNAPEDGFVGGKKTDHHKSSYYYEHENAVHTVHSMAHHDGFSKAIKQKHLAIPMGTHKGEVSAIWKKYGATNGTSKSDIAIIDPKRDKAAGIRVSMKKGVGSQLMSAGPEETQATYHYAASKMLEKEKKYARKPSTEKAAIHADIMKSIKKVATHFNSMKEADEPKKKEHATSAQKLVSGVHEKYPELNAHVRQEATTGEGKFGSIDSPHAAKYLIKSSDGKKGAQVKRYDEIDYNGSVPRASVGKGYTNTGSRSGVLRIDER